MKLQTADLQLSKSLYADDSAFIFLSREELIASTQLIVDTFKDFGLDVHLGTNGNEKTKSKTEAMHIPKRKQQSTSAKTSNFPVGNNNFVSFCTSFKYLGSHLTSTMTDDFEIDHRIVKVKGGFATGIKFLTGKGVSIYNRKLLYICIVVNILLFGCETWAIKEPHFTKLEAFHTKHLRKLLGLNMRHVRKHHITNEEVYQRVGGCPTIKELIRMRQIRFLQNIATMPETRLTRQIMKTTSYKGLRTTRESLATALQDFGLTDKFDEWTNTINSPNFQHHLETTLHLKHGKFKRKPRPKRPASRVNPERTLNPHAPAFTPSENNNYTSLTPRSLCETHHLSYHTLHRQS